MNGAQSALRRLNPQQDARNPFSTFALDEYAMHMFLFLADYAKYWWENIQMSRRSRRSVIYEKSNCFMKNQTPAVLGPIFIATEKHIFAPSHST